MFHEYSNLLVLAPHADDEVIGALGTLYDFRGAITIAFLTDGAPAARWRPPGLDRSEYRRMRRDEARQVWVARPPLVGAALPVVGLWPSVALRQRTPAGAQSVSKLPRQACWPQAHLRFALIPDQQLALRLEAAAHWLDQIVAATRPDAVLTPAFEGGHPDHDAANVLASVLREKGQLPVWEYALYTAHAGVIRRQEFPGEPQWTMRLHARAAVSKRAAFALYCSQAQTLADFSCEQEAVRPLPPHDYRRPALPEPSVYELWGWPWSAQDVARQFSDFLARRVAACRC